MSAQESGPNQYQAVEVTNPDGQGGFVFVCEHASRFIPEDYQDLGLDGDQVISHIAWDPGALAVAKKLSAAFDSPLVAGCLSRLLYDCNRPPHAFDAIPMVSEIHTIPGNQNLSFEDKRHRIDHIYIPFQDTLETVIKQALASHPDLLIVTVHSFVPVYKGQKRAVEVGFLHDEDSRFVDAILEMDEGGQFVVARNEPYGPEDGVTHTLRYHALPNGIPNVMIEIRNDLIQTDQQIDAMSDYLHKLITKAVANADFGAATKSTGASQ